MSELTDLALKDNINLDECIVFTKDNGDILSVNIKYVGIKQRQDKLMGVNFSMSPKQVKQLDEFFSTVRAWECGASAGWSRRRPRGRGRRSGRGCFPSRHRSCHR